VQRFRHDENLLLPLPLSILGEGKGRQYKLIEKSLPVIRMLYSISIIHCITDCIKNKLILYAEIAKKLYYLCDDYKFKNTL
jgi:hypothetical protein